MRAFLLALFSLTVLAACATEPSGPEASAPRSYSRLDPKTAFQPSQDAMGDVDAALARAAASDKLALVILGANWCHDTRAFIETLNSPEVSELVYTRYEVVLVDVGFLERGRDVIERFGMPVIYGTPTLLIVEPETDLLINRHDMHRWRDAAKIEAEEAIDYFTDMAAPAARDKAAQSWAAKPAALDALYAEIDAFERAQAERIYGGFEVIGPMIAKGRPRPPEFDTAWGQVRDLRYQITEDLAALRKQARDAVAAGETDIVLTYPDYPPFDWE